MSASKNFWDKRAQRYDAKLHKGPNYAARLERAAAVFGENANVLDVGCATGEITLDLAAHAGQITGIDLSAAMVEAANHYTPLGRVGEPEDIAKAVELLLLPQASWITGQVLIADGGWSLL